MKTPVFLSWSGERSKAVAEALRDWLPTVVTMCDPWISTAMDAGTQWFQEIGERLSSTTVGVLCLTPENWDSQWINFEAGAIGKALAKSRVCPYLFGGLQATDMKGPLPQYNAKIADENGTLDLVRAINGSLPTADSVTPTVLDLLFKRGWKDLALRLSAITDIGEDDKRPRRRKDTEVLHELLDLVRSLNKRVVSPRAPVAGRRFDPSLDGARVIEWAASHRARNPFEMGLLNFERCKFDLGLEDGVEHDLQYDEDGYLVVR